MIINHNYVAILSRALSVWGRINAINFTERIRRKERGIYRWGRRYSRENT